MLFYTAGTVIVSLLKEFFGRNGPLPYDAFHTGLKQVDFGGETYIKVKVHHFPAFPSGHTAMSVFVYLTLAILAGRAFPGLSIYFIGTALIAALLIGLGKMYLGAHYGSDVIAGYSLGLFFSYLWFLFL